MASPARPVGSVSKRPRGGALSVILPSQPSPPRPRRARPAKRGIGIGRGVIGRMEALLFAYAGFEPLSEWIKS